MSDSMQQLTDRTAQIVDALASAMLATAETAAEKITLAAEVARVQARMQAFASVLEAVAAQRAALESRMESASGPMRALLARQIECLSLQEVAVLEKAGAPPVVAAKAVDLIECRLDEHATHARDGRRFRRVPANNGHQG